MSKGSPVGTVRLPQQLLDLVESQILSRNRNTMHEEYGLSGFIFAAVCEKMLKMARSRGRRRPAADQVAGQRPADVLLLSASDLKGVIAALKARLQY